MKLKPEVQQGCLTVGALGEGARRTKCVRCQISVQNKTQCFSPFFISLNSLSSLQTAALAAPHAHPSPLYYPGGLINVLLSHGELPEGRRGAADSAVRVADVGTSCVLHSARLRRCSTRTREEAAGGDDVQEWRSSFRFTSSLGFSPESANILHCLSL